MPDKPVSHGNDHRPGGFDPTPTGPWHDVGGTDVFADGSLVSFINGANAAPTAEVPNPSPLRFRLAVGAPNVLDWNYPSSPDGTALATAIREYTKHQVEIQGDVTDVNAGDIVFVLPMEYRHEVDLPCHAHDDAGNYVPCRLLSTGEFYYGVA